MERKSLSRNLKKHSLGKVHHHHNHPSWDNCGNEYEVSNSIGDLVGGVGFSWPPRSYSCGFCGREFRSAQALGGHMNVHRRDRARLQQSPPPQSPPPSPKENHPMLNLNLHPNLNPNPNPNPSPSPNFSSSAFPLTSRSVIKKCGGDHGVDLAKMKAEKTLLGDGEFEGFEHEKEGCRVRLDLEIGLGKDSQLEDLDLELRLGYS